MLKNASINASVNVYFFKDRGGGSGGSQVDKGQPLFRSDFLSLTMLTSISPNLTSIEVTHPQQILD